MKKTKLSQFFSEKWFIEKITKLLEEKYKVYPSVKVWNHTVKLKDWYFTISNINLALKEIFKQSQA